MALRGVLCAECTRRADAAGYGRQRLAKFAHEQQSAADGRPWDGHVSHSHTDRPSGTDKSITEQRRADNAPSSQQVRDRLLEHLQQPRESYGPTPCCPVDDPCNRHRNQTGNGVTQTPADTTTNTEGGTMPEQAEVTGVKSAIAYAEAVSAAHAAHGGAEQYVTSLTTMEVGSADIAKVRAAQEASRNAAAMWKDAAEALTTSNAAVGEAYMTSPDAANKQAQTNE